MKDYMLNISGNQIRFKVHDEWIENLKIKATEDVNEQIYAAAVSDPELSGIETDNDALNADIEEVKKLVERAKEINRKSSYADVRVKLGSSPGVYTVTVRGEVRNQDVTLSEATRAVSELQSFFAHHNAVRTAIVNGKGKTVELRREELEIFLNNQCRKVLDVTEVSSNSFLVVYTPKRQDTCCEIEVDED